MPLLNSRGDVLAGTAGMPGSLNGVPFPFAAFGGGCWLDDETVLVSIPVPGPLEAILATWRPGDTEPAPLPERRGANDFSAGGGRFIAWLSGYGAWGTLGHLPAAGVAGRLSVAPDGTIAYIPDRGYGYGLTLVDPDGLAHDVPGIYALAEQTVRAGVAVWQGGAFGLDPAPRPACANAQGLVVAELPDRERWLVDWADGVGFVAQLDGAADGYVLGTTPTFFNHHARAIGGELVIAWSRTAGEAPGDIEVVQVNRALPRESLVPVAPPVAIPTFTFTHPVIVAPFKDPEGDTRAPYEIVVNQYAQTLDRPCFVAEDSLGYEHGPMAAIYSEAVDPVDVLDVAAAHATRLMLAHDSIAQWDLPEGLRPFDLPTLELYLSKGESLDESVARWYDDARRLLDTWPGSIAVIPMFYCMGGAPPDELFPVADVLAGLAHLSGIVNLSARILVIAPFAYMRANGITGHAELQQAFAALLAEQARVGLATLPPITADPEPPEPPDPGTEPEPEPPPTEEITMLFIENEVRENQPRARRHEIRDRQKRERVRELSIRRARGEPRRRDQRHAVLLRDRSGEGRMARVARRVVRSVSPRRHDARRGSPVERRRARVRAVLRRGAMMLDTIHRMMMGGGALAIPPPENRAPLPPPPPNVYTVLPWAPPKSRDYLLADCWGITLDGLPFVPGGSSNHPAQNRFLSWFFDRYPPEWQQRWIDQNHKNGYTHVYSRRPTRWGRSTTARTRRRDRATRSRKSSTTTARSNARDSTCTRCSRRNISKRTTCRCNSLLTTRSRSSTRSRARASSTRSRPHGRWISSTCPATRPSGSVKPSGNARTSRTSRVGCTFRRT